eukprot:gnl/TRDRNA2_/TRDRNA2_189806_c0_seq1.p1 gnl/TRDRNA2_/TRDRNA2_189806_c0~~gnl/TRDRNA2_/TRDRNA2_189806_c0_seq1.p1  ORF type:complete len:105 (-),score=19.06 gnl/TRDRNA2_/TRDRNA2_189806_c0_seq1:76-390(-)
MANALEFDMMLETDTSEPVRSSVASRSKPPAGYKASGKSRSDRHGGVGVANRAAADSSGGQGGDEEVVFGPALPFRIKEVHLNPTEMGTDEWFVNIRFRPKGGE